MMKKFSAPEWEYVAPRAEEIRFESRDILTLSGDDENTKFY